MNKDQIKGIAKEAAGEIQEQTGKILEDDQLRASGHAREFEGKAQRRLGDLKEIARVDMVEIEDAKSITRANQDR